MRFKIPHAGENIILPPRGNRSNKASQRTKNRRRGFSVAETVIALTIIVLVTATSLTLITSQLRIEQKTSASIAATNLAENAIECFRYAEDTGADIDDLLAACGYTAAENGEKYTATDGGAYAEFTLSEENGTTTATVTVTDGRGKRIVRVEYKYNVSR